MQLIQISAWNDSGGGFTNRLFDGHPQLRVWPFELLLGRDNFVTDCFAEPWFRGRFRWPRLDRELALGDADVLFDAIADSELKAVLATPDTAKHAAFPVNVSVSAWRSATRARWAQRRQTSQAEFLSCYVNAFFEEFGYADDEGRPVLGHCPALILDAPEMWADFPDAKIVHVIRSPLGGFTAMQARHPSLDAVTYGRKWALINGAAAMWAGKRPTQVTLVALKSLLERREDTLRQIATRLRIDFDENLLTPTWCGKPLDEARMGPFGGVADLGAVQRDDDPPTLAPEAREKLEAITYGAIELLSALNLTL
jgi:hypothetical protein